MSMVFEVLYFIWTIFGRLAEWLGIGLQNRVRRFESATDLNSNLHRNAVEVFFSGLSQLAVLRDGGKNLNSLHRRMKVWVEGPYLPDHRR